MDFSQLLEGLLEIVLVVALPLVVKFLGDNLPIFVQKYSQNVDNKQLEEYIAFATNAVVSSVNQVSQTFVSQLKASGDFDANKAEEAFYKAKAQASSLMSDGVKEAVAMVYGDVDMWISTIIEETVYNKTLSK